MADLTDGGNISEGASGDVQDNAGEIFGMAEENAGVDVGGSIEDSGADCSNVEQPAVQQVEPTSDIPVESAGVSSAAPVFDTEEDSRKLFVGGLAPESTRDDVQKYFAQFGDVIQCTVKTDVYTGRSRGFGFVVFKDAGAVEKTLALPTHQLHGKFIDPKRANPKVEKSKEPVLKVFVGGIDPNSTREELIEYFTKFGQVASMDLPTMKKTEERRGFIFVTFETEEAVDKCCEIPRQTILGRECDVKKATPKQEYQKQFGERGGFSGGYSGSSYSGGAYSGQGAYATSTGVAARGARGSVGGRAGLASGRGGYYRGAAGAGAVTYRGGRGAYQPGFDSQSYAGYGGAGTSYGGGYDQYSGQGYYAGGNSTYEGYNSGAAQGYGATNYDGSYYGGAGYGDGSQPAVGKMRIRPRGAASGAYGYQPY